MKGSLVVVEGADASGKRTQSELLVRRLRREGKKAALVSFPRYGSFFGRLVKKYLGGGFGSMRSVPPEFASLLYALDRYDAMPSLERSLRAGKIIVADRYSASNIAHQAAKLGGARRKRFIEWLGNAESRLPEPAATFYLDVPVEFSQRLMCGRGRKKDLHEKNIPYLKRARQVYLSLARQHGWEIVVCVKKGRLLSVGEIHSLIWKKLQGCI